MSIWDFFGLCSREKVIDKPIKPSSVLEVPQSKFLQLTNEEKTKLRDTLLALVEVPYKFGAEVLDLSVLPSKIKQIDCSETVQYGYYQIGKKVRDGSFNQFDDSDSFEGNIEVGDLVFYRNRQTKQIGHVGICIGNDELIEANGFAKKVIKNTLQIFQRGSTRSTYAGIRRLLKDKVGEVKV